LNRFFEPRAGNGITKHSFGNFLCIELCIEPCIEYADDDYAGRAQKRVSI
jgi:hypothetical protein